MYNSVYICILFIILENQSTNIGKRLRKLIIVIALYAYIHIHQETIIPARHNPLPYRRS